MYHHVLHVPPRTTPYHPVSLHTAPYHSVRLRTTLHHSIQLRTARNNPVPRRTTSYYTVPHRTTPYYPVQHRTATYDQGISKIFFCLQTLDHLFWFSMFIYIFSISTDFVFKHFQEFQSEF